jgi:nicotinate-nucleotide adenylyltransferase
MKEKRIGILGGTFNPIHLGHINLGRCAVKKLKLDKLFFVPAYIPPHKKIEEKIAPKDRAAMVRLAIKGQKAFGLSLFEISKKRKSYSVKTLEYFTRRFKKNTRLFFITGADSLTGINTWKNVDKVLKLAQFVVFSRPGFKLKNGAKSILKIKMRESGITSTNIRALYKTGRSVKRLVPRAVLKYMDEKRLYRGVPHI